MLVQGTWFWWGVIKTTSGKMVHYKTYPATIKPKMDKNDRLALRVFTKQCIPIEGEIVVLVKDRGEYDRLLIFLEMLGL